MRHALALCVALGLANLAVAAETPRPKLTRLTVESGVTTLDGARAGTQLLATAFDVMGNPYDVTEDVRWEPGKGIAIDDRAWASPREAGRWPVIARLGDLNATLELTVSRPEYRRRIEFQHDVIPALTRAGCNQGGMPRHAHRQERFPAQPSGLLAGPGPRNPHP